MVRPKKRLGQHFLTNKSIAERITGCLKADGLNTVIEVGPGKGVLTEFLLNIPGLELILVEIDPEASAYLLEHFPVLDRKSVV